MNDRNVKLYNIKQKNNKKTKKERNQHGQHS